MHDAASPVFDRGPDCRNSRDDCRIWFLQEDKNDWRHRHFLVVKLFRANHTGNSNPETISRARHCYPIDGRNLEPAAHSAFDNAVYEIRQGRPAIRSVEIRVVERLRLQGFLDVPTARRFRPSTHGSGRMFHIGSQTSFNFFHGISSGAIRNGSARRVYCGRSARRVQEAKDRMRVQNRIVEIQSTPKLFLRVARLVCILRSLHSLRDGSIHDLRAANHACSSNQSDGHTARRKTLARAQRRGIREVSRDYKRLFPMVPQRAIVI